METDKFTITKKIAKHGKQAIIVIPKILNEFLKPETLVKLNIEIIKSISSDTQEDADKMNKITTKQEKND